MALTKIPVLTCVVLISRSVVLGVGEMATLYPVDDENPPRQVTADIPAKTEVERGPDGSIISETVITPLEPDLGPGVELISIAALDRADSIGLPKGAPDGSVILPDGSVLAPKGDGTYAPWTPEASGLAAAAAGNPPEVKEVRADAGNTKPVDWSRAPKADLIAEITRRRAAGSEVPIKSASGEVMDLNDTKTTNGQMIEALEADTKAKGDEG